MSVITAEIFPELSKSNQTSIRRDPETVQASEHAHSIYVLKTVFSSSEAREAVCHSKNCFVLPEDPSGCAYPMNITTVAGCSMQHMKLQVRNFIN